MMTDAQQLFNFARSQFNEIAADVERHFDHVADSLRDSFSKIKSPQLKAAPPPPPPTSYQLVQRWVSNHRALTAAIVAFVLTGSLGAAVYVQQAKKTKRRRRARKSPSGARTDVVVVAGAVANPLASALYLDLERRGFVVYVIVNHSDDELYVRSQARSDIIPFALDLVDPYVAQEQLSRFQHLLARDHYAFDGAPPHRLTFSGLILIPDTTSSPARISDLTSEEWSDALNSKVLATIATTQHLLPSIRAHHAPILLLAPSITPSLRLPGHGLETTMHDALAGFTASLAAELRPEGLSVSHFHLGTIDIPSVTARQRREGLPAPRLRPTPIRVLHDAVFDSLITSASSRRSLPLTRYIGRGSLTYDFIGRWVPPAFIAWMMTGVATTSASSTWRKLSGHGDDADGEIRMVEADDLQRSSGSLTWEKIGSEESA